VLSFAEMKPSSVGRFLTATLAGPEGVAPIVMVIASSCAAPAPPVRPDILLISIDTVRADHCSAYGYSRPTTPTLDRLARTGVRFDAAYAPMATTGPSHATMFTGLYPRTHGVVKNGYVLAATHPTLASSLRAAGYRTAAFIGSYALAREFGYGRGFEVFDEDFRPTEASIPAAGTWEGARVPGAFDRRAEFTVGRVAGWLRQEGYLDRTRRKTAAPYFLWVHFFDPHSPYQPPAPYDALFAGGVARAAGLEHLVALYDGEIRYTDAQVAALLNLLRGAGRLDDTLVVVVGDHGEGLMDHGHLEHGLMIYEEAVRVPLIFHWPARFRTPGVVTSPVELVDLRPTLLALAGAAEPGREHPGLDLRPRLLGRNGLDPERPVYLQRRFYEAGRVGNFRVHGEKYGIRMGRWKYIEAPEEGTRELFDLIADPREERSLHARCQPCSEPLAKQLEQWRASTTAEAARPRVPEDVAERLRALGYTE
jgi:arylsulfatase A-like enzyme